MKSLLMFPDRDFTVDRSLLRPTYRERDLYAQDKLPFQEQQLIQDLELNALLQGMAKGDEFVFQVARKALLAGLKNDTETILHRQCVLRDCLKNAAEIRQLYALATEAIEQTRKGWWSIHSNYPSSLLYNSISLLELLLGMLKKLRSIAEQHVSHFGSRAFTTFFAMLRKELDDDYLSKVQSHLSELQFRKGVLMSAELGEWNESIHLLLREIPEDEQKWLNRIFNKGTERHTFHLAERDEHGARILSDMRNRGISRVAIALGQSADHVLGFFEILRSETAFYVGCLNLFEHLRSNNEPICFPIPTPAGSRTSHFAGLYDVCLSLQTDRKVIGNAIDADGKNVLVITGANQGGKSTFLRSVGIAQLMMQCGMFVGAELFEAELASALFTHYKREEDQTLKSGKFDEELARLSHIVDQVVPHSILLFNESFAATNEREGSEIARQIISALREKGVKVFYVTHLYDFAHEFFERHLPDAMFLRAERKPDGTRTFQLIEGEPLATSFGKDLYQEIFASAARAEV